MIPSLRRVLPLMIVLPALALGACGSSGSSDEDKIKDIVKSVDKDPAALCDQATEKLLVSVGGTADKCKEIVRGYKSQSNVTGDITVKINGTHATAEFDTSDGGHQTATFVKQGDTWKIDTVSGA